MRRGRPHLQAAVRGGQVHSDRCALAIPGAVGGWAWGRALCCTPAARLLCIRTTQQHSAGKRARTHDRAVVAPAPGGAPGGNAKSRAMAAPLALEQLPLLAHVLALHLRTAAGATVKQLLQQQPLQRHGSPRDQC